MPSLELFLFGSPRLERDNQPLVVDARKTIALLAYLAITGTSHSRETILTLLWPELEPRRAQNVLRRNLSTLNKTLNGQWLVVDRDIIGLDKNADTWLDVTHFRKLAGSWQDHDHAQNSLCDSCLSDLAQAAALYRADFLAGFSVRNSVNFDEWQFFESEQLKHELESVLARLVKGHRDRQELDRAVHYAQRWLTLDPLHEPTHRQLMSLYAAKGDRSAALRQYQISARLLEDELGVEPEEETTALYENLRQGLEKQPPGIEGSFSDIELGTVPDQEYHELGLAESADLAQEHGKTKATVDHIEDGQKPRQSDDFPGPAAEPPPSPYRGLYSFQEKDAPYFFGRETFTRQLLEAVHERALVAVVGPSGSGKSSVVLAGLLPQLRQEANWVITSFRPGTDPFWGLAAALTPYLESELSETDRLVETRKLAERIHSGELLLDDVVNRILQKNANATRVLLVADQFEELYTICPDPERRHHFFDVLLDIIELQPFQHSPTFNFIFTLRADFLEQVLSYRPMADVLQDADLMLGPMNREELSQAVELPAEKVGVCFEAGLVERILDDGGEEPGTLPLLEFALAMLWERQQNRVLTHDDYESIARVEGALTQYAEQFYEALSLDEQETARQIFIQLVRPGEGTEDTRRVARRHELRDQDWQLGQKLADARLVVTGRDLSGSETIEVVHEALIRNWSRLKQWIEDDRNFRSWQERLRISMRQWEENQQDEGALLHGIALAEAQGWLAERENDLNQAERSFIQASIDWQEALEAEQENERRARERLRLRIVQLLAAGLAIALLFSAVVGWQWLRAERQRLVADDAKNRLEAEREQANNALSRQLATQAAARQEDQIDLSLLLSIEANQVAQTVDARRTLRASLVSNPRLSTFLHGHNDRVTSIAFTPDGQTMASGSNDDSIRIWDVASGQPLGSPLTGHTDNVLDLDISPVDPIIASASSDKTVRLWNMANGQLLAPPLTGHTSSVRSVDFSPDGQTLASTGDQTIILWDLTSSPPLSTTLSGHTDTIRTITFSPDGQTLASGSDDQTIIIWDVDNGEPLGPPFTAHAALIRQVSFSPDGQILASAGEDGAIKLWTMNAAPTLDKSLDGHTDSVRSISFRPNQLAGTGGYVLASGGLDGSIMFWNTATGSQIDAPLIGHTDWVRDIAFSPDGNTLASASHDEKVILWDVNEQFTDLFALSSPITEHEEAVRSVAFSPDGKILASAGDDKTIILWDAAAAKPLGPPLTGHTKNVRSVAFSPDGQILASGSGDETVILWDPLTGLPLTNNPPLTGHTGSVRSVAFDPDGNMLASASDDGSLIFWDTRLSSWQARACSRANRNLSQSEWQQFFGEQEYVATCPDLPVQIE